MDLRGNLPLHRPLYPTVLPTRLSVLWGFSQLTILGEVYNLWGWVWVGLSFKATSGISARRRHHGGIVYLNGPSHKTRMSWVLFNIWLLAHVSCFLLFTVAAVQSLSCVQLCKAMVCSTPGFPVLHYLPELAQTHVHRVGDAIQPSHPPLSLLLLPSVFPSIRVFSNDSSLRVRWPKYWSFSISPSTEYSGLISFRIDWFDLLAVQGTLKGLLQHHSLKASGLWCSAFCMVRLSIHTHYWKNHSFK